MRSNGFGVRSGRSGAGGNAGGSLAGVRLGGRVVPDPCADAGIGFQGVGCTVSPDVTPAGENGVGFTGGGAGGSIGRDSAVGAAFCNQKAPGSVGATGSGTVTGGTETGALATLGGCCG